MTGAPASLALRGGVIAAGHGTRLKADGYRVSKPMTPVGGRPLIEHALDRFRATGVRQATIIVNEDSDDCRRWLSDHGQDLDLDVIVRTTPSSYASFELVAARLAGARAVITTVDAIMPLDAFRHFVKSAASFPNDAVVLGLTGHVDDDNPLWATLDADGRIRCLGGAQGSHVTAGLYWLPAHQVASPTARFERLRDYLKWLVDEGRPVYGVALPLVFDIDRAHDVEAAEQAGFRRSPEATFQAGSMDGFACQEPHPEEPREPAASRRMIQVALALAGAPFETRNRRLRSSGRGGLELSPGNAGA
jgi:NDP-sugar pyrophosphorylase family protein